MKIGAIAGILVIAAFLFAPENVRSANNSFQPRTITASASVIGSLRDLDSYLRMTARSGSPLDRLSPLGRARFLASLTFNKTGVTGFRYDDLQADLSASQIYQVLSLFGLQRDTSLIVGGGSYITERPLDYRNYYCASLHSCAPRLAWICVSGC
jgi:hypothetical protein